MGDPNAGHATPAQPTPMQHDILAAATTIATEVKKQFWPIIIAIVVINALVVALGFPLLNYIAAAYIDDKLKTQTDEVDKARGSAFSAQDTASRAIKIANDAEARAISITKSVDALQSSEERIQTQITALESAAARLEHIKDDLAAAEKTLRHYDRLKLEVPIGAMLPYFGQELPEQFVWADGRTNWPNEPWVPEKLRNTLVPDMNGWLIGGTGDQELLGRKFTGGHIEIEQKTIAGKTFTLPDVKLLRISAGVGSAQEGGFVGEFNRNGNYSPKNGGPNYFVDTKVGHPYGGTMAAVPGTYFGYDYTPALSGNVDLIWEPISLGTSNTLPRHYLARWIIRIR
ncbi:MAG TPA: hypothetical protein VHV55_20730 [Pirellulales bacterium]|jgi:hypothetical protein|nr:hypothetical protein [Pirellulales bacterium]